MRAFRRGTLAIVVGVGLAAPAAAQQPGSGDGLVHSQFTMTIARSVAVAFPPALGADEAGHRELLMGNSREARVRIGELWASPRFRMGGLEVAAPGASNTPTGTTLVKFFDDSRGGPQRFELWLARDGANWALEAGRPADDGTAAAGGLWEIPLTTATAATASPTLSAAVVPTADTAGMVSLRWVNTAGRPGSPSPIRLRIPPPPRRRSRRKRTLTASFWVRTTTRAALPAH